ncbi:hypothetical protein [Streptomyces sp. NPDC020362]|uniref:hypothetical protein n=1 Tax=unclassified Streptomyces TaxID=2593676 RepID=UPI00340EC2DC
MISSACSAVLPSSADARSTRTTAAIVARLTGAHSPAILGDIDADRFDVTGELLELAGRMQLPIAAVNTVKVLIDETSPYFLDLYAGAGSRPEVRETVENSDCLPAIGVRRVDTTSLPPPPPRHLATRLHRSRPYPALAGPHTAPWPAPRHRPSETHGSLGTRSPTPAHRRPSHGSRRRALSAWEGRRLDGGTASDLWVRRRGCRLKGWFRAAGSAGGPRDDPHGARRFASAGQVGPSGLREKAVSPAIATIASLTSSTRGG